MDNKYTKGYTILIAFLLLVIFLAGCGGGDDDDNNQDRLKNKALSRNTNIVTSEAQRTGLQICNVNDREHKCADGGKKCKSLTIATEPGDCGTPPTLLCICPERTACSNWGSALVVENYIRWGCLS